MIFHERAITDRYRFSNKACREEERFWLFTMTSHSAVNLFWLCIAPLSQPRYGRVECFQFRERAPCWPTPISLTGIAFVKNGYRDKQTGRRNVRKTSKFKKLLALFFLLSNCIITILRQPTLGCGEPSWLDVLHSQEKFGLLLLEGSYFLFFMWTWKHFITLLLKIWP